MKVTSNVGAAQDAVSGFAQIKVEGAGQKAALGSSNVASIQDGAQVANNVLGIISELLSGVKVQAANVPALALEIENRDRQDAQELCEAR